MPSCVKKGIVSNISYEYEEERINEVYKFFQSTLNLRRQEKIYDATKNYDRE